MKFEEKMARLDQIINIVNKNELPLEESIKLYQEGKTLIDELKKELTEAEEKITKEINN